MKLRQAVDIVLFMTGKDLWGWEYECHILCLQLWCCYWLWGWWFLVSSIKWISVDGRDKVHVFWKTLKPWRASCMVHHIFCFFMVRILKHVLWFADAFSLKRAVWLESGVVISTCLPAKWAIGTIPFALLATLYRMLYHLLEVNVY